LLFFFGNDLRLVLAALSITVFADTAAALIGKKFGKCRITKRKSLEGTSAFFIAALVCIIYFYPPNHANLAFIIGTAIIASLAELLPINDNVDVPIITGIALRLLF
jgi:dolichol kinase